MKEKLLIIALILGIILLAYQFFSSHYQLRIIEMKNCEGIEVGEIIYKIGDRKIEKIEDLEELRCDNKTLLIITDKSIGKCKCENGRINVKVVEEIKGLRFSSEFCRIEYLINLTKENGKKIVENRIKELGMEDYEIFSNGKLLKVRIPCWFRNVFESYVIKPGKIEFWFEKIVKNDSEIINELQELNASLDIKPLNQSFYFLRVKVFDTTEKINVKGGCSSQIAERCEIIISFQPKNVEKFKKIGETLGVKLISFEKFVDANFSLQIDNKTFLTTLIPFEVLNKTSTTMFFVFPVKSYEWYEKYKKLRVYSHGSLDLKVLKIEKKETVKIGLLSSMFIGLNLILMLFLYKTIKLDRRLLILLLSILPLTVLKEFYIVYLLLGMFYLFTSKIEIGKKILILFFYLLSFVGIQSYFYFSIQRILLTIFLFLLLILVSKYFLVATILLSIFGLIFYFLSLSFLPFFASLIVFVIFSSIKLKKVGK